MSLEEEGVRRLRASAHPTRLRIMSLLTGAQLSAAEVARELDLTQANASYHVRLLADAGLIELAGTEKVRGGVAKRYRYVTQRGSGNSDVLREHHGRSAQQFPLIVEALTSELQRRAQFYDPGAERSPQHNFYADLETWIDPETWGEVVGLVQRAAKLAHENAQPPRTEGTVPVNLVASLFRMRPPAAGGQ